MIFYTKALHSVMYLHRADLPEHPEASNPAEAKLFLEEGVLGQRGRYLCECGYSVGKILTKVKLWEYLGLL